MDSKNTIKDIDFSKYIDFQKVKFDAKIGVLTINENPVNNIVALNINKSDSDKYASIMIQLDANLEVIGTSDTLGQVNYNSEKDGSFSLQRDLGEGKARIEIDNKKGNLLFFK